MNEYDEDDIEMNAALRGLAGESPYRAMTNAILTIVPYRDYGTWVFDDPARGLVKEPFVLGIPKMIDAMVADIPSASEGFRLNFTMAGHPPIKGVHHLKKAHEENGGAWYRDIDTRLVGWLCPATLLYFLAFPDELWCWAEEMHPSDQYQTRVNVRQALRGLGLNPNISTTDCEMLLDDFGRENLLMGRLFYQQDDDDSDSMLPRADWIP